MRNFIVFVLFVALIVFSSWDKVCEIATSACKTLKLRIEKFGNK